MLQGLVFFWFRAVRESLPKVNGGMSVAYDFLPWVKGGMSVVYYFLPKVKGGMSVVYYFGPFVFKVGGSGYNVKHEATMLKKNVNDDPRRPSSLTHYYAYLSFMDMLILPNHGPSTLSAYITPRGHKMPLETVIDCGYRILKALVFMHKKNIIHGDIKPANVCVKSDGSDATVVDLGISSTNAEGSNKQVDEYTPPEHIMDDHPSPSVSGDLWAFGVIVYQLLEHEFPFGNEIIVYKNNLPMLRDHVNIRKPYDEGPLPFKCEPVQHSIQHTMILQQVRDVIRKMLAYEGSARYPSASEVSDEWPHGQP